MQRITRRTPGWTVDRGSMGWGMTYKRPLAAVAAVAGKAYKKYRSSRAASGTDSTSKISTFQDSSDRMYGRRRMPRRKVRRVKRFYRTINKVINSNLADLNFRRVTQATVSSATGDQGTRSFSLMSGDGNSGTDDDLNAIINSLDSTYNPGTGISPSDTNKYQIKSAVLDVTIFSPPTNTAVTFCDFYYVVARKDVPTPVGTTIDEHWANEMGRLTPNFDINAIRNYGVTPFQTSGFCQYWLITKVQRVQVSPGQTISVMLKRNKLRAFNSQDVDTIFARKGFTRGILMVYAGGPDSVTGTPSPVTLGINYTRTYCMNILSVNQASYQTI